MPTPNHRLPEQLRRVRMSVLGLALLSVLSCKETFTPLAPVANITLAPASLIMPPNSTVQLEATLTDAQGAALEGRTVRFASSNASIATVSATGLVTAVRIGSAIITATADGKTATAPVDVVEPIGSIVVAPTSAALNVGDTRQLTVSVQDASGRPIVRTVTFHSSNPAVATVTANGLVAAVSVGNASITASAEGKSGACQVSVQPVPVASVTMQPAAPQLLRVGTTLQVSATPRSASNQPLPDRPVVFSSTNPAIATVSASGLITAVDVGVTSINAESEGKVGSITLTVTLQPVATVTVVPANATIGINQATQLNVSLADSAGRPLSPTGRVITWTSTNNPVASVNAAGVVTGVTAGTAQIQATVEGKTGTASVNVTP